MKLLLICEVAELLNVSTSRAYALARSGTLPTVRLGRQLRIDAERLEKWIADGGQALSGGWRQAADADAAD